MSIPLLKLPLGGFGETSHEANNSQKTFSYGPGCSKESWESRNFIAGNMGLMGHGEEINVIKGLEMQFSTTGKNMTL